MKYVVAENASELARRAASDAAARIRATIAERGRANIVFATGASQQAMLEVLTHEPGIKWGQMTAFHLDEYLGLDDQHPASFCCYLRERVAQRVPIGAFHWIDGSSPNPQQECRRLAALIAAHPIDVALIGIGENGHLAFNDPPADFETSEPFWVVDLDDRCRQQQVGEGWFTSLAEVPRQAITMSIRQILSARMIVCTVPDARKAEAVAAAVLGPLTPDVPASILRQHADATIYLDRDSARLITN